jgi:uncharacterized membrane protein YagU involved in acid resistance
VTNVKRIVRAGLTTAIVDGLFSSVLTLLYGSTVSRLFQNVASTVIGKSAFTMGARATALGVLMHFSVAFFWSAVFVLLVMRSARIRAVLASRYGKIKVSSLYGPAIWLVMSLLVIPILLHRPPTITYRWWIQLAGHFPFVGLPIVLSATPRNP